MGLSKLNYSQETYPKIISLNNDTLVIISLEQVKKLNITFEHRNMLAEQVGVLNNTIDEYVLLSNKKDSINADLSVKYKQSVEEGKELNSKNIILAQDLQKIKKQRKFIFAGGLLGGILLSILL